MVIDKSARPLTAFHDDVVLKTHEVALGGNRRGHKERLHISYPNAAAAGGLARAPFRRVAPSRSTDWQMARPRSARLIAVRLDRSCIAVTHAEIEELWRVVPNRTPVLIEP